MIVSRLAAAAALSLVFSVPIAASPPGQTIAVWSFGFAPNPIRLSAGRPITLTFQNRSGSSHDFTAKQFFAYSRITAGGAPEGEIELKLPSERSFAEEYEVAYTTVRHAMAVLRERGIIVTVHGRGTFVAPREPRSTQT